MTTIVSSLFIAALSAIGAQRVRDVRVVEVPVIFSGGHETQARDGGRPVILIAGALGIAPSVFRDAFSRVQPAPSGQAPDQQQVRNNKDVLLSALQKFGVTNERLDEVSDYYRYNPASGRMWPIRNARGYALVKNGKVIKVVISNSGEGYSSSPQLWVNGRNLQARIEILMDRDFHKNGRVSKVTIPE